MIVQGNLTQWGSQWMVQPLADPGDLGSSQVSWILWLRDKEKHVWKHQASLCFTFTHKGELCCLLGCLQKSLDLWEKSSRHQIRNQKNDLFSLVQYVIMVFQYQNDGREEISTENYCHADFQGAGHWPGPKELCFIPSFVTDSLHDSGQVTISSAQLPSLSEGDGIPLPPWGALRPRVSQSWEELGQGCDKGFTNIAGEKKLLRSSLSAEVPIHTLGQTSLLSFCSSKPPTHISNGVRKNWVKQPAISPFGQTFSTEIWTKQKVDISKNWQK